MSDEWITPEEAAALYGISAKTIRARCKRELIIFERIGEGTRSILRINKTSLEEYQAKNPHKGRPKKNISSGKENDVS